MTFWMKKKIKVLIITTLLIFNLSGSANAIPVGPIKNLFLELIEKIPTFFDDLFKRGKNADEVITNNTSKNLDDMKLTLREQKIIFKKVSKETHNFHLDETLNKSNIEIGLKHGVRVAKVGVKKTGKISENLIDYLILITLLMKKNF